MHHLTCAGVAVLLVGMTAQAGEPDRVANFFNVVSPSGADPWVYRHSDGWYYATFTTASNVTILRSRTIAALGAGDRKVVFTPPPSLKNLWAPELHWIDRAWYVYFAADNGDNANHRMYVLENQAADPFTGTFTFKGKMVTDPEDHWAIDGSVLRVKDRHYFIWSGWEGTKDAAQDIYIAAMENPWTISGSRVPISRPDLAWEQRGGPPTINEGPEALAHGEDLFVVYSAAASWTDHYVLGQLKLTRGADPLDPKSWSKTPSPVFASANGVFGPGHCSFTKSIDGREDWIVYHSAKRQGSGWARLLRTEVRLGRRWCAELWCPLPARCTDRAARR